MMGCVVFPLLFVLVTEMILRSAEVNTNEITGPSMKAFRDDVTPVAKSRSHLQVLFKWTAMKIKPSKCSSLPIIKGNCREIKFSVGRNKIPTICEKRLKSLCRCYSLPLTDRYPWQDLSKLLKDGLCSIDKCDLNIDKV